jgi:hypothetical protein
VIVGDDNALSSIAASNAQASAAVALAAAGPNYASTAAGLAATVVGETFAVDEGDNIAVYRHDAGPVATFLRRFIKQPELPGGSALIGFEQEGTGAVARTVQSKLRDALHLKDFGETITATTLQAAVNRAAATGRALYLGDDDFTIASTITLPDGDYAIVGPGSAALTITFTGTGGLFIGTGLAVTTKINMSGFTARAGAAGVGVAVQIGHATTVGIDQRAVTLSDITVDCNNTQSIWWDGGFYITEGSLAVLEKCFVHGPTADLSRTDYAFKFDGEAFDCKLSDCGALSVGRGVDISGGVEGTIISNFTAVDVNVGVYKSHDASVEPWIAMSGWHIAARQKGFYLDNVFQTTITNGLLFAVGTAGVAEWIGVEIENSVIGMSPGINRDIMIDFLGEAVLADSGTVTWGMRGKLAVGVHAKMKLRDFNIGVELQAGATDCFVELDVKDVDTPVFGPGVYAASNNIVVNRQSLGYFLPKTTGAFNPDDSSATTKAASLLGWGRDTVGNVKVGGGLKVVSRDQNWVSSRIEIEARESDAVFQVMTLLGVGSPEGVVTARIGSLYTRIDGGAGTTLYVKESGTGNTGWVAK